MPCRCLMTHSSQPFVRCTINYGITRSTPAEESHAPGWIQHSDFMQKARDLLTNTRPLSKEDALIWSLFWHIAQMAMSQDLLPFREKPWGPRSLVMANINPTAFAELKITVVTNKKDRVSGASSSSKHSVWLNSAPLTLAPTRGSSNICFQSLDECIIICI